MHLRTACTFLLSTSWAVASAAPGSGDAGAVQSAGASVTRPEEGAPRIESLARVYREIGIPKERQPAVRQILRDQRQRLATLVSAGKGKKRAARAPRKLDRAVHELASSTDARLLAALGDAKFREWNEYRKRNARSSQAQGPATPENTCPALKRVFLEPLMLDVAADEQLDIWIHVFATTCAGKNRS